ncbi:MAG: cation:proton antiporter [Planctomycetes bacterium]|nr:cation:proton antiporter [Planctomycetota bacterium]
MSLGLFEQAALVIILGVGAQWIGALLRLPAILLLLGFGILVGPIIGLIDTDRLVPGDLLPVAVSLSIALILFEGGLTLKLAEARQVGTTVGRLVSIGVLVNWVIGGLGAWYLFDLSPGVASLAGAILVLSGPTVVQPLLRTMRPIGKGAAVLKWEGIVVDPVGALLATLVFQFLIEPGGGAHTFLAIGMTVVVGGGLGLVSALLLVFLFERHLVPDRHQITLTLALVLAAFTVANLVQHEAGLFSVTLMGFVLANQKRVSVKHIIHFKEHLAGLLIASLFVLLAARLDLRVLLEVLYPQGLLFLALLVLVARPLGVWLSTLGSDLSAKDRLLCCLVFPRGILAAAVAPLFAYPLSAKYEDAARLVPIVYLVIVGTVMIYGVLGPFLARRLGVSSSDAQGVLFLGAMPFARDMAAALKEAGVNVLLTDTNPQNIREARLASIPARFVNLLDEDELEHLDLGGLSSMIALTPNDEVNALACGHGAELFGRKQVFQLVPGEKEGLAGQVSAQGLRGRSAFSEDLDFAELSRRVRNGFVFKRTRLGESFDFDQWKAQYGERAYPLFKLGGGSKLEIIEAGSPVEFEDGDALIGLVPSTKDAPPVRKDS